MGKFDIDLVAKITIGVCASLLASACTIYKSSDRDSFDSNAYLNPAKSQAIVKPESSSCETVALSALEEPLALETHASNEAMKIEASDTAIVVLASKRFNDIAIGVCRFVFKASLTVETVRSSSRSLIETYVKSQSGS